MYNNTTLYSCQQEKSKMKRLTKAKDINIIIKIVNSERMVTE